MKALFEPDSIAVVGASSEEGKVGHIIMRNLIGSGFKGEIHPVNPKAESILDRRCHSSISDIPGKVDLVIIVIPARFVPSVMREAGVKGVRAAIIISAGFKEIGREGAELEREISEIGSKYDIRILGPNCLGLMNTSWNMNATFTNLYPLKGHIGFSSQSGAVGSTLLDWSMRENVGFSKFVSVGNKVDVNEADLLRYLREDEDTRVIGMYIEGVDHGKEFMEEASLTARKKPIIALKSGRTSSGAKAASSHTGAISGSDAVYDAAMQQVGAIRVKMIDDFFDLLSLFSNMPLPKGDGVAIVTNAGGLGVMAADACSDYDIDLARLGKGTADVLTANLPEAASVWNPVDVLGDATAERYDFAIKQVMKDTSVHCVLVVLSPLDTVDIPAVARLLASYAGKLEMPLVAAFVGGDQCEEGIKILREAGIPNYDSPDRAIKALATMTRYMERKCSRRDDKVVIKEGNKTRVREILDMVRKDRRNSLSEEEGKELLKAYGVPTPPEGVAKDVKDAIRIAEDIGYPVVMKVVSPDILHKSDVGGVAVGVASPEDVRAEFRLILERSKNSVPGARIDGVSIQKMLSGREVIVAMVRDDQFGPVMTFGLGGIFVEIMKDVSQRIAPLTEKEVSEMISSIRAYPILAGARGRRPADVASVKDLIFRVAQISLDFPEISELEINPVIVGDDGGGCGAVDALVTIRRDS
jgi:acetyl coenzyme A synthetase (ADP forming)-like protein